jgi:hypothetical protein
MNGEVGDERFDHRVAQVFGGANVVEVFAR